MKEYHKINTVWNRTIQGQIIEGQYACPEFDYLKNAQWLWTEKVDGTNIRIIFHGGSIRIGGKTDNSQIPAFLVNRLQELFTIEKLQSVFPHDGEIISNVCLYGEGYGAKIQKGGGNYKPDGVDFVLFDVLVDEYLWLERRNVEDIAGKLGISFVPIVGQGNLFELNEFVKEGYKSTWGDFPAEGVVARPLIELRDRRNNRIITKLKHKDFK